LPRNADSAAPAAMVWLSPIALLPMAAARPQLK